MLALALVFVIYGYDFALFGALQTSELAGLPMVTIYIAWPLAGVTWLFFLGDKMLADLRILFLGAPP